MVTPAAKREAVLCAQERHGFSQRRACRLMDCNRRTARHSERAKDEDALRQRMKALAEEKRRWGYRRLCAVLRREGWSINPKRAYRIYKEEHLALRPRHRKRLKCEGRGQPQAAQRPNEIWALDFVSDMLADGRTFRTLNLIDVFTRQCHAIEVDTSLGGYRVARVLDRVVLAEGKPKLLRIDNGPEFRCKALDLWAAQNGVELQFIDPGKPTQNGHVESFNGKFREECLDQEWFVTLREARSKIERWRQDYNEQRPHSSLGYLTPSQWAAKHQLAPAQSGEPILPLPISTSRGNADNSLLPTPSVH
jgi:putative transposase